MSLQQAYTHFSDAQAEVLDWFQNELTSIRTGRVTTQLIEHLPVEHYGTRTPLQGLASLTVSDARTIVVNPWDPTAMPAIEKALTDAQLGVNPVVDNNVVRLSFPSLTEDARTATIKLLHKKAEEARVKLRQARDEALTTVRREKEAGELTEDDFYDGRAQLDTRIGEANERIAAIITKKEVEIRTL